MLNLSIYFVNDKYNCFNIYCVVKVLFEYNLLLDMIIFIIIV